MGKGRSPMASQHLQHARTYERTPFANMATYCAGGGKRWQTGRVDEVAVKTASFWGPEHPPKRWRVRQTQPN
jgi:hypothetical protein